MAVEVAELLAVCRRRNKLILPAGLKMRERFYIRVLAGCASRYYIATPYDFMNIEEAMGDERLSEQEEQELVEANTNYLNLNNTSINRIARLNWDKVDPRFVELYRQIDRRLPMPS